MTFKSQYLLAAALGVVVACASSGGEGTLSGNSRLITRAELDQLTQLGIRNLREAVARKRPTWLTTTRSASFAGQQEIAVFQDQTYLGGLDALNRMGLEGVYELRYLDGAMAQATLAGIQNRLIAGAIVVHMRPPP